MVPELPLLLTSLNNSIIEQTLREVIGQFEQNFPGRIRSFYIEGSFAEGSSISSSDLDVAVVFKDNFHDKTECQEAERLGNYCAGLSVVELDFGFEDEAGFEKEGLNPALKLSSQLIYGEDIRDKFKLVSIEQKLEFHSVYSLNSSGSLSKSGEISTNPLALPTTLFGFTPFTAFN